MHICIKYIHNMYIYAHTHTYIYIFVCMHACMQTWIDGWMDTWSLACLSVSLDVFIHKWPISTHTYYAWMGGGWKDGCLDEWGDPSESECLYVCSSAFLFPVCVCLYALIFVLVACIALHGWTDGLIDGRLCVYIYVHTYMFIL